MIRAVSGNYRYEMLDVTDVVEMQPSKRDKLAGYRSRDAPEDAPEGYFSFSGLASIVFTQTIRQL